MFECLFEPVKISLAVFSRSYCCFRFWFFSLKSHPPLWDRRHKPAGLFFAGGPLPAFQHGEPF